MRYLEKPRALTQRETRNISMQQLEGASEKMIFLGVLGQIKLFKG